MYCFLCAAPLSQYRRHTTIITSIVMLPHLQTRIHVVDDVDDEDDCVTKEESRGEPTKQLSAVSSSSSPLQRIQSTGSIGALKRCDASSVKIYKSSEEVLSRIRLLGRGAYADVYHMIEKKSLSSRPTSARRSYHHYAAKVLNRKRIMMEKRRAGSLVLEEEFATAQANLMMEASILSQLDHENIIKLHGISFTRSKNNNNNNNTETTRTGGQQQEDDADLFLLFDTILQETLKERLDRWRRKRGGPWNSSKTLLPRAASLDTLLGRVRVLPGSRWHPGSIRNDGQSSSSSSKEKLVNIDHMYDRMQSVALPVVKAMKYLHEKNILHRDLKPANIGFSAVVAGDDGGRVQLFDFGFARHVGDCSPYEVAGTPRFIAPEVLEGEGYSFASDVYSFGVLFHELCTLKEPAPFLFAASCSYPPNKKRQGGGLEEEQEDPLAMVTRSVRETSSRLLSSLDSIPCRATKELIRACVKKRASDRPSFARIEKTLMNILLEE